MVSNSSYCKYFPKCGGCSLQHLSEAEYQASKIEFLRRYEEEGTVLHPMVHVGSHARRRVSFKVSKEKGQVKCGFFEPQSIKVVDITDCPVTDPKITSILIPLKACLAKLQKPGVIHSIDITLVNNGLDVSIIVKDWPGTKDQHSLEQFFQTYDCVRLYVKLKSSGEFQKIFEISSPYVLLENIQVEIPTGGFLQSTLSGQQAITKLVLYYLNSTKKVLDLFCGCGTYSFPLATEQKREVMAYEGGSEMVQAMQNAIRRAELESKMEAQVRDLFKHPLSADQLNVFDGIVINPPRLGAKAQCQQIANSQVKKVVMVSCNPSTFDRDKKILESGGFQLQEITPIDQFLWTKHLELVGYLTRE